MNALVCYVGKIKQGIKNMSEVSSNVSKMEQRMWSILISVALAFGGIWLQNQYSTTIALQQQLTEYMRFVDDKYVDLKLYQSLNEGLDSRLNRIEDKIDTVLEKEHLANGGLGSR